MKKVAFVRPASDSLDTLVRMNIVRRVGHVAHVPRRGGVVVLPTDTVYAFACASSNPADRNPARRLPDPSGHPREARGASDLHLRSQRQGRAELRPRHDRRPGRSGGGGGCGRRSPAEWTLDDRRPVRRRAGRRARRQGGPRRSRDRLKETGPTAEVRSFSGTECRRAPGPAGSPRGPQNSIRNRVGPPAGPAREYRKP
jgi:hypothetical protein